MLQSTDAAPEPKLKWQRRARGVFSSVAMTLILLASVGVIAKQLIGQIDLVQAQLRSLSLLRLIVPMLATLLALLMDAVGWHRAVAACTGGRSALRFYESFAILNASNLAKYLPGKVWAYGIQAHVLRTRGVPVSATLHANLTFSLAAATAVGWLTAFGALWFPNRPAGLACAAALTALLAVVHLYYGQLVSWGVALVKRRFGRDLPLEPVAAGNYFVIVLFGIANLILFGVAAAAVLSELDGVLSATQLIAVNVITAASWLIGFIAFFVPGGLGVRETAMAAMLVRVGVTGSVVLVPLITRVLVLAVEALYGGVGLLVLWRLDRSRRATERFVCP